MSGLEDSTADYLTNLGVDYTYEERKIKWDDSRIRTYTPDFVLPNGIIIETKGWFKPVDRVKHLRIKEQYPLLDIRFVFSNSNARLNRSSKTTYGLWCDRYGFKYSDVIIPTEWIKERKKKPKEMEGLI